MTHKPLLLTLAALLLSAAQALAITAGGESRRLTAGWQFIRQDMGSIWEVMRPVQAGKPESVPLWTDVTLPHCFNALDAVDPDVNYYQGAGWYRTLLTVDNPYAGGRTLLHFEGAGQKTEVYVYTTLVATHTGGYDEWEADLTDAIAQARRDKALMQRFRGRIPVAVRCDNSRDVQLIPSDMSDFNLYGGLYRYVNLKYVPALCLEDLQVDARVDERGRRGTVEISIGLQGEATHKALETSLLETVILAPDGTEVASQRYRPGDTTLPSRHSIATAAVIRPQLWSPDSPALYTCRVRLSCGADTVEAAARFGFRHFRFEEHGPFYLNGRRLLLRGTHRHEDHAGRGAALTEELMEREMKQIKAMGANFIRLGHYQQSDIILRLCDELGLLVWEEIPWCRGGLGGDDYRQQARRMLTNMITQHRNHPSVILWGLGNENDWPGDFTTFDRDSIRAFMAGLNELAHRLDPSRLTTIRRCDFCSDIVDVYSPSIWAGWYSGRYRDYRRMTKQWVDRVPRFVHAEWGGDSHPGRSEEDLPAMDSLVAGDRNGRWSESYIVRLFDWHLKEQEQMPWLTGALFWTFKDFSTPLRPTNPIPYVNQKGVVQRDGTPKESYYVFQSYWAKQPMVHIYGHDRPVRWGKPGEPKEVLVYSNCAEVELFVNGTSQGVRRRDSQDFPAAGLHWNVTLREGQNTLKAVAKSGKAILADSITQEYQTRRWGAAAKIRLTQQAVSANTVLLRAEVVDKDGTRCLDHDGFIEFGCTHPQALVQNQGTSRGSRLIQAADGRAEIYVVRQAEPVAASVRSRDAGIQGSLLTVNGHKNHGEQIQGKE